MATYHENLRVALDAGHPTTGPYSAGANAADDVRRINEVNLPGDRSISETERAIRESGKWTQYREKSEKKDVNDEFENPGMHDLMSAFLTRTDGANFQDDYWNFVLQQCVSEGSMGQGAADQLREWSDNQRSHASIEGLGSPTLGDVEKAWSI